MAKPPKPLTPDELKALVRWLNERRKTVSPKGEEHVQRVLRKARDQLEERQSS